MAFSYKTKILHTSARFPMLEHTAFYFPPFASKDRAVNSMEIKDFLRLWTYSQWRQAIVVIPPLSREGNMWYPSAFLYSNKVESTIHRLRRSPFLSRKEHRFSCFHLISFRLLALCKKRIFRFTPAIPGDCTVPRVCSECLPGFPQISRAQFSLLSFLSSFSAVQ